MKIILQKYGSGFGTLYTAELQNASWEQIEKVMSAVMVDPKPATVEPQYVDMTKMPKFQLEALYQVASMHLAAAKNNIETIKLIRSLTATAPLKEAKQLVDYAGGGPRPEWFPINSNQPNPLIESLNPLAGINERMDKE